MADYDYLSHPTNHQEAFMYIAGFLSNKSFVRIEYQARHKKANKHEKVIKISGEIHCKNRKPLDLIALYFGGYVLPREDGFVWKMIATKTKSLIKTIAPFHHQQTKMKLLLELLELKESDQFKKTPEYADLYRRFKKSNQTDIQELNIAPEPDYHDCFLGGLLDSVLSIWVSKEDWGGNLSVKSPVYTKFISDYIYNKSPYGARREYQQTLNRTDTHIIIIYGEYLSLRREEFFSKKRKEIFEVERSLMPDPRERIFSNMCSRFYGLYRDIYRTGKGSKEAFLKYLGIDKENFIKYIELQFDETMNWNNYGLTWGIDHIIPCAYYSKIEGGLEPLSHYTNIRPLDLMKNCSKCARWTPEEASKIKEEIQEKIRGKLHVPTVSDLSLV